VVLFHVTANAEWSTLPLSGLFVQMLERLAVSTRPAMPDGRGTGRQHLGDRTAAGRLRHLSDAGQTAVGVPGRGAGRGPPRADLPPGVYADGDRRWR
jgi:hypothetical protein